MKHIIATITSGSIHPCRQLGDPYDPQVHGLGTNSVLTIAASSCRAPSDTENAPRRQPTCCWTFVVAAAIRLGKSYRAGFPADAVFFGALAIRKASEVLHVCTIRKLLIWAQMGVTTGFCSAMWQLRAECRGNHQYRLQVGCLVSTRPLLCPVLSDLLEAEKHES